MMDVTFVTRMFTPNNSTTKDKLAALVCKLKPEEDICSGYIMYTFKQPALLYFDPKDLINDGFDFTIKVGPMVFYNHHHMRKNSAIKMKRHELSQRESSHLASMCNRIFASRYHTSAYVHKTGHKIYASGIWRPVL